ncbi:hypothetical protein AB0C02_21255 [Micromonospora sp. NPDC048999]|uniref:hypothetical protein n=1 Tax=Micromonospora sp. NPDC048999 TaxID=3155391 RepID=UPI0033EE93B8
MDGFWSGAVSALIGAVVGGVASWLAAWIQVRGAIRAAKMQTEQSLEDQRLLRREEREYEATRAYYPLVHKQLNMFWDLKDLHGEHTPTDEHGTCPDPTTGDLELKSLWEETNQIQLIHCPFLHPAVASELEFLHEALDECQRGKFNGALLGFSDPLSCKYMNAMVGATDKADWALRFFDAQLAGRPVSHLITELRARR